MRKQAPFGHRGQANKRWLAEYYQISCRTLDYWIHCGILAGTWVAGEHIFNVAACDEALLQTTRTRKTRKEMK